ncbi:hypothetical protein LAV_00003 [Sphingobium phage Lacusarx]|uniref:Uncharacterized protein n=1 Tax=Sphingobium phage Lacusarx TaxID=1980139 RepID=A0A1W6DWV7_9CAUD|nr:hypothetical protein FDH44_gp003 [Sphingobium phage Lacusarx]ARK07403.1 hypothetical protein LAV_00003 [Sphingobium phage Lacusarx]
MELTTLIKTARPDSLDAPELPMPKFKTLVVARNKEHAAQLRAKYVDVAYMNEREIDNPAHGSPHFYVTYPYDILSGRRFEALIIQAMVLSSLERDPKGWDWYQEIALTRLLPGADVKVVH